MEMRLPAIGDFSEVVVIEVHVTTGDVIAVDDPILTLETDKATMDVPAMSAGVVQTVAVAEGDRVSAGDLVLTLEGAAPDAAPSDPPVAGGPAGETTSAPAHQAGYGSPAGVYGAVEDASTPNEAASSGSAPEPSPSTERPADVRAEVLVLGAGPGGYTAAFRAADLGKNVVLVDRSSRLGGVCLNVGCIPSKALLHAAKVIAETTEMSEHGLKFSRPQIDLDQLRGWKDGIVARLTGGLQGLARQRRVTVIRGTGSFVSDHQLEATADDGSTALVEFESAILAVGSEPVRLPFVPHDDPGVLDSTDALEISDIPERLLILGGGIIGLEMATVYAELGSRITVVELMDQLIPGADPDIVAPLSKRISKRYDNIYLKTKVTNVTATPEGMQVTFEGGSAPAQDTFDKVLVAVGRRPNGALVGADKAGVQVDGRGFIPVDSQLRTNVAHIYAIGDVVGQPMLAHKATHEARVAAEAAAGHNAHFDARVIPSVAYTDPEVAWVGMTETEAQERNVAYGTGVFPWAASGRSLSLGRDEGITKLLFDPETDRLLGCGIVGPSAGDLIAEAALAIEMGADAADIGATIHPHPTLSETVGMGAEAFEGTITDLYLPRKDRSSVTGKKVS